MHKTKSMEIYNHIAESYIDLIHSCDYQGALTVNSNAVAYLETLNPSAKMYGDNFGWITAGELHASANKREAWLKAMADMSQNMHIN